MTCTDEDTPVFRRSAANPDVGISWLSDDSYCCPHFICTTCGKPIRRNSKRDLGAATSMAQRWRIMRRDEWTCQRCHRSADEHRVALHVDHMQPASKGGTADDANLWTLCEDCNLGKSDELS